MMKAFLRELPLEECRAKYLPTGLSKIPDNLRQTQMCATGSTPDGSTIDACQGKSRIYYIFHYHLLIKLIN